MSRVRTVMDVRNQHLLGVLAENTVLNLRQVETLLEIYDQLAPELMTCFFVFSSHC